MALIDDIRSNLRVSTTDAGILLEIQDIIDAAKADLILSGVLDYKVEETDPLIKRAIILYAKANFGIGNDESEKFQNAYESLKNHLTLSIEYTVEV